jgi:hypothetical protein
MEPICAEQVPQLCVHTELLSERACLAIRRGGMPNLVSLRISSLRDENDVQVCLLQRVGFYFR